MVDPKRQPARDRGWELDRAPVVPGAMADRVVLAGLVLAGVALWVGVYTALLPTYGPAGPVEGVAGKSETVPMVDYDQEVSTLTGWDERPGGRADPMTSEGGSTLPLSPDMKPVREGGHGGEGPQTRRTKLANTRIHPRIARERIHAPPRTRARGRHRRVPEPIQFRLATRSSS